MAKITFIQSDGTEVAAMSHLGDTLMTLARNAGVAGIIGECGGSMACATCHCHIDPEWFDKTGPLVDGEADILEGSLGELRVESRLGCQVEVTGALDGMIVRIPTPDW